MNRVLITLAALATGSVPAVAQIRASERSTLSQTIDGTLLTIDYARPRARGRTPIFGKVVTWGETWTPGANWATTIETSKAIEVSGQALPKGKYSVWLVVRQTGAWTLVLDPDFHRFHMEPPDSNATQIRIPVTRASAPITEVLTWSFPEIRVNGGTLAMQWGESMVSVDVKVTPSLSILMAKEAAEPFLGRYTFSYMPSPGEKADTSMLVLTWEKGSLYASFVPNDDYYQHFVMIALADGSLVPGLFEKGEIYEVIRDMIFEFKGPKDRPDSFDVRDDHDEILASGKRLP